MIKVYLGTFYGEKMFIEDNNGSFSEKEWQDNWSNYLKSQKKLAVDDHETERFFREVDKKYNKKYGLLNKFNKIFKINV